MRVAGIEGSNAGNDGRGRSTEEPWPPRASGIPVFGSLAILVFLLALLCALYHTRRLEERLHGRLDESPVVSDSPFDGESVE